MSNTALTYVWTHSKQASTHLLVMIALADAANNDGVCWWGKTKLSERCRLTEARLKTVIRDLERAGELQVIEGGFDKQTRKNKPNHYLIMGLAEPSAEARPIEPAKPKKRNFDKPVREDGGNTVDPHTGDDRGLHGLPPGGYTVDPPVEADGGNTVDPKPIEPSVNPIAPDGANETTFDEIKPYMVSRDVDKYGPVRNARQSLEDAIYKAFGWEPKTVTASEKGKITAAVRDLYPKGYRAESIPIIYAYCNRHYKTFGPNALASNASAAMAETQPKTIPLFTSAQSSAPALTEAERLENLRISQEARAKMKEGAAS